jgi:hypothetical protein
MPSTTWAWRAFVRQDNDKLQHGGRTSIVHYTSYQFLFCSKSDITQEVFHTVFNLVRITDTKTHRKKFVRVVTERQTYCHLALEPCCPMEVRFRGQYCPRLLDREYVKKETSFSSLIPCLLHLHFTTQPPVHFGQ